MLEIQKKYYDFLVFTAEGAKKLEISNDKINELADIIKKAELIVPVIGAFSAGKSTFINSFIGKQVLLTGITPETALATELHYSAKEYIEVVKTSGAVETYSLDEIQNTKNSPENTKFVKIYLNSENLKKISPLVLVDMPGFDSPLDEHNKAIFSYINKGVYYILLTSVEEGSITNSMLRQIENIETYERDFSVFLSKSNLRSESEVEEIKEKIEEQLDDYLLVKKEVQPIYKDSGSLLKSLLTSINPETLFKSLFENDVKNSFFELKDNISLMKKSFLESKEENSEKIAGLKETIKKIERKKTQLISEAKDRYSKKNINYIVDDVGKAISNSADELATIGATGDEYRFNETLADIIKNSLMSSTKYCLNSVTDSILNEFKIDLAGENLSNFGSEFSDKIVESIKTQLGSTAQWFKEKGPIWNTKNASIYKIGTTLLAVTTSIVAPIIELLIIFLPDIVNFFLKSGREKRIKEQIKNKLMVEVIPQVKQKIRAEVSNVFREEVGKLVEQIGKDIEVKLQEKTELLNNLEKERESKNFAIEQKIKAIETIENEVIAKYQTL